MPVICPAGFYCNASAQFPCSLSNFCPPGSSAQTQCLAGYFCGSTSTQTACTPGNVCPSGSTAQTACPATFYCPTTSTQLSCTSGNMCPSSSTSPTQCPPGQYCVAGVSIGTTCSLGYTCPAGSSAQTPCTSPTNSYFTGYGTGGAASSCPWMCNAGYFTNGSNYCTPCPFNSWCIAGANNACPSNTLSPGLSTSQNQCLCAPGYFGNGSRSGTSPCPICTSGAYCPGGNGDLIIACPVNYTSPVGSSTVDACKCKPGYKYAEDNATKRCEQCVQGEICFNGLVTACPANSLSPPGSSDITECECLPGFSGINGGACLQCPANSVCTGGSVQLPCTENAVSPV